MNEFCVAKIEVDPGLRPRNGVLRAPMLAITTDAQLAAERILNAAHAEAARILTVARDDAERIKQAFESDAMVRAQALLDSLERAHDLLLDQVEETAITLAQETFARLVADMTEREKVEACVRRIRKEAPTKLTEAVIHVHPADVETLGSAVWPVQPDEGMARHTCRLVASTGQWCVDFDASASALADALARILKEVQTVVPENDAPNLTVSAEEERKE